GADAELGDDPAGRHHLVRVDHHPGDHRRPGLEGEPRHPGLALVEAAVRGSGSLRVDAEHLALAEDAQAGAERRLTRLATGPVDGHGPDPFEERPADPPLDPAAGEVFDLAEGDDLAREEA